MTEPILAVPVPPEAPAGKAATVDTQAWSEERARLWKRQVVIGALFQIGGYPNMILAASLGYVSWGIVLLWAPLSLALNAYVYVGLSLGWTAHRKDPTLTGLQIAYSLLSCVFCYAVLGPMRMATLAMACLAMLFSIFALPIREVRWLAVFAVAAFSAVMVGMALVQPARYPALEELANFSILVTVMPGIALLAGRLSALRSQLGRQRAELAQAMQRQAELASRDELTGLMNRRRALEALEERCAAAQRDRGFFVVLADIDHFKRINDVHGHAAGDAILCHFAREAARVLRRSDVLARWGGEEFLLLLPTDETIGALSTIERLRAHLAAGPAALPDGTRVACTLSFGLARHCPPESGLETIRAADAALYRAKDRGRNRVEMRELAASLQLEVRATHRDGLPP